MKNMQALETKNKPRIFNADILSAAKIFATLFAISCLAVLSGCQNPFDARETNEPQAETGTVSLTIGREDTGRMVRPDFSMGDFVEVNFAFVATCNNGNSDFSENWTRDDNPGAIAITVDLAAGIWDLQVTAYIAGEGETTLRTAMGSLEGIEVIPEETVGGNVRLYPITTGAGTFSWDITLPTSAVTARMEIMRVGGSGDTHPGTFYFVGGPGGTTPPENPGRMELDAGRYRMLFTLYNARGDMAGLRTILHIYQNMESHFEETFTDNHFAITLEDLVLGAWDGTRWEFADEITAGHLAHLGIGGVDNDNFHYYIIGWLNSPAFVAATPAHPDLDALKVLVDAALISIAVASIAAADHTDRTSAEAAIAGSVGNDTEVTFVWSEDGARVTVRIGDHEVEIEFDTAVPLPELTGTVSITGTAQVGQTLTANTEDLGGSGNISFQWMRGDAPIENANGGTYVVQADDIDAMITVVVNRAGNTGSVASNAVGPVVGAPTVAPELDLVSIPSGIFMMGSPEGTPDSHANERPVREVTISSFYMGRFPVTQGEWYDVMETDPSYFHSGHSAIVAAGANWRNLPVERVNWYDALVFSNRLSIMRGLSPAYSIGGSTNPDDWGSVPMTSNATWNAVMIVPGSTGYRLPTEAQWEFAARGGHGSPGNFTFSGSNNAAEVAWHSANSGNRTHEVGRLRPNALGLYDMSGNVSELVWDWFGTYPSMAQTNPTGATSGNFRMTRGGGWNFGHLIIRSTTRSTVDPNFGGNNIGIRVVRPGPDLPELTGTVTITGTAQVGQTLTADTNDLDGSGDISFLWRRGTTNIGTNSSTYVVQAADVGSTITVTVTRSDNSGSVTSTAVGPVTAAPLPPLIGAVFIIGTAQVGQTLTANTAALGGSGDITFQWRRGNTDVGTNSSTYVMQAEDVGSTITVVVTRAGYSGSVTGGPTATVIFPPLTGTVIITGTAQVGQTLTANTDDLGGSGDITFQWRRGNTDVGTNSSTYVVQAADVGSTITVVVTRTGHSGSVTGGPTAIVIFPPLTGTVTITGTAQVGQALTANTAALGGSGDLSFQWMRGDTPIESASGSTYVVQAADVGSMITVVVSRTGYSGSVESNAVGPVIAAPLPPLTGTVIITGTAQVGQTLTANTDDLGGSGTISYQWLSGTTNVGTNSSTYIVQTADVGLTITVIVTRAGHSGSVTSAAIGPVTAAPLDLVRIPGGTFLMGSPVNTPNSQASERPVREVTISSFYMGRFLVTQGEWYDVMGTNPSGFHSRSSAILAAGANWRNLPVEMVSWYDALVFSNRLSIASGLTPAYSIGGSTNPDDWGLVPPTSNATWNAVTVVPGSTGYRLPTEAQWEFAARGGHGSPGNFVFSGSNVVTEVAWHSANSGNRTHEVGALMPNALGLYDMSGNVWEWVWDRWGTYPSVAETDPTGPAAGDSRVRRGGGWNDTPSNVRSAHRNGSNPFNRFTSFGFRLVRPDPSIPELTGTVSITGTPEVGQTLTANTVALGGSGMISFQWQSGSTGVGTGSTYVVQAADVGSTITVVVTRAGHSGSVTSVAVGPVVPAPTPSLDLVRIPGGTFMMGSPEGTPSSTANERPVREVTISSFYMGRFPVTQGEWYDVMGTNPSNFHSGHSAIVAAGVNWRNLPIETVSWYDALVFSNRLSIASGLTPAYSIGGSTNPDDWGSVPATSNATWNAVTVVPGSTGYRLPTEAQWEFAARGGNGSPGNFTFSGSNNADEVAWIGENSAARTHEVGTRQPNALGLYDMTGNVWEWVWDWWGAYPSFPETNPTGPAAGDGRMLRGGSWSNLSLAVVRSAHRNDFGPGHRADNIGFRVVRP